MLHETLKVAQVEGEHRRRWFNDEYFDLIVWFDEADEISGFQLCYNVDVDEHAVTWHRDHGFAHNAVDSGDERGLIKMTPILISDGEFDQNSVVQVLEKSIGEIDPQVANFVLEILRKYPIEH